jgi:hypothetical protein
MRDTTGKNAASVFPPAVALLTSLYPGYHPETGPASLIIGTFYSLITGAAAGTVFGWLYNSFVEL